METDDVNRIAREYVETNRSLLYIAKKYEMHVRYPLDVIDMAKTGKLEPEELNYHVLKKRFGKSFADHNQKCKDLVKKFADSRMTQSQFAKLENVKLSTFRKYIRSMKTSDEKIRARAAIAALARPGMEISEYAYIADGVHRAVNGESDLPSFDDLFGASVLFGFRE